MTLHVILQPPCVTLKLSLQNLQYANDGPLLLAVIPGDRVQEDKNLAGFLFAGSSILFFPSIIQISEIYGADEDAFSRKNTEDWQQLSMLKNLKIPV